MRQKRSFSTHFKKGVVFLGEHPQLWFTAVVGVAILFAFIFVAYSFTRIAQDAQQQLFNDRAGWLLDSFVQFAPDVLHDQALLQRRVASIVEVNPTIERLTVLAPYTEEEWRVYVTMDGDRQGTLTQNQIDVALANHAKAQTRDAFTTILGEGDGRRIITVKAIVDDAGSFQAVALLSMKLSEADRVLQRETLKSYGILIGVLIVIMVLFVRHARIIDYASLYKKQLEVDEMKDSFISMASHELKSPLSVIRGYIEFLKEGVPDETKRQEYLRRIDLSATELRQLVDDILDVSRIEMGRLRFSPDYVVPAEVLSEVHEMFTDAAKNKGLELALNISDEVAQAGVRVDRGRLKQVMVNLASNAVKYTLTGSITIEQKRVGESIELSVRDTGVGMTSEEQAKLFGKFYRVEADETQGVSGTGLGLWITKYIVEHMAGQISVESIKGDGSRFVVRFPEHFQGEEEQKESKE